jgi:hypothetical protein
MYLENWEIATADSAARLWDLLAEKGDVDARYQLHRNQTEIHVRDLPFYRLLKLYRLRNPAWRPANVSLYFLFSTELGVFRLDGTSPPIHEVNKKELIALNEANVLEYLAFFCFFVRGEEGPFYLIRDREDSNIPPEAWSYRDASSRGSVALDEFFRPPSYHGISPEGHYRCSTLVYYSNAIFLANLMVHSTGMVEMAEDEPLAADLPSRVDRPIA